MSRDTEVAVRSANSAIRKGLRKHYAGQPVVLNGKRWSVAKIIAALDSEDAQFTEASQTRTAWLNAARSLRQMVKSNHQLRLAIRAMVEVMHGKSSQALMDFGYKPRKRRKPSAATTKAAVEKRRATRAARNTLGPKQRKKIKGVVPPP